MITRRSTAGILATATMVAFAITAFGAQATGRGNGIEDPTSAVSFERTGVGGRAGCEVQSWPDIPAECLIADENGNSWKATRRLL